MRSAQILCLCSALLATAKTTAAQTPPDMPVATRQNVFNVPFEIPEPRDTRDQPIEVQLYVSVDRGASWTLRARQHPSTGKFPFHAAGDGEYWFASRTLDRAGRTRPEGALQPELRVTVDTMAPRLLLFAAVGPAGEVRTTWEVTDANLAPESFQLHYQKAAGQPWQVVAVHPSESDTARGTLRGGATFWPDRDARQINLRAQVRDRAGNPAVVHRMLLLPRVAERPAVPGTPLAKRPPSAASPEPVSGDLARRATTDRPAAGDAVSWPADHVAEAPLGHGKQPAATQSPTPDASNFAQRRDRLVSAREYVPDDRPADLPDRRPSVADDAGEPNAPTAGMLPAGERPRMTHFRRFNLQYDVESVGPSGVARVELWGTADGGRTWKSWGTDDDRQSPFSVEVPGEGVYGFRLVVEAGNGLAGRPPRPGDPAEIWIGVDTTPPTARITSAIYGEGDRVGRLDIHWEADDSRLAAKPVTLLFSDRPGGPWTTIAAGLPNTGLYSWRVDARVPARIYLRLEVRDEADNLAAFELERPIANDGLVPQGRVLGIRPGR